MQLNRWECVPPIDEEALLAMYPCWFSSASSADTRQAQDMKIPVLVQDSQSKLYLILNNKIFKIMKNNKTKANPNYFMEIDFAVLPFNNLCIINITQNMKGVMVTFKQ